MQARKRRAGCGGTVMVVMLAMAVAAMSAGLLRIERLGGFRHGTTQAAQDFSQFVVFLYIQCIAGEFGRSM